MYFEIVKYPDELTQEIFTFWLKDTDLVLDRYYCNKRVTKKHKYRREIYYSRIMSRDDNITVDKVPLTSDIIEQAINEVKNKIRVIRE